MQHIGIHHIIATKPKLTYVKRVENKVPKDSMDSGLGTPLKYSKQIPENTWFEENYAQNVSGWNNLTFPNTSVLLSETAK